ncbi:Tn3 family transposase [Hymenobacter psoromatis]|uniref:Tn3 family transposase n=1 Tax=Hymenobacter psoromatis TaxID=1484116 RepID=UPI001CC0D56B|nr:Tn3 family transposase [Hymenobacter psoromatis]
MPVEFLSDEQAARYGRYQADPNAEQLTRYFYLSPADAQFLAQRRRAANKLGCAVQLGTLRFLGTFLPEPTQVPAVVVEVLAIQLGVDPAELAGYRKRPNTWHEHQPLILAHLGYQPYDVRQSFRLTRWLYAQALTSTVRPSVLVDLATAHLIAQRVVLPGVTVLARLIARVRERTGRHLYRQLHARLTGSQRTVLEALLTVPAGERLTKLELLRTPPTRVSAPALVAALHRVDQIRALGVSAIPVADLPEARLARLARQAHLVWAQTLVRMGEERRLATLLVFVQALERTATDDLLDLFDNLLTSLALRGETKRRRERLRSLKDLDQAALVLQRAVLLLLDDALPAGELRQQVLDAVGEERLRAAAATVQELATPGDDPLLEALSGSYATVRRFLPALLAGVTFEGTPAAKPLLEAWSFLQRQEAGGRGRPKWAAAPRAVVPTSWARRVFPAKAEVNVQAYTLCVLERLHQALRRREVFVPASERYADPRAELLRGVAWETARDAVARALDRSLDPAVELAHLQHQLRAAYTEVSENLAHNTALQLVQQEGTPTVVLTPLPAQAEPASLARLRAQVANALPQVELAALLLEVEAFTGFASAFTHVADGQLAAADLPLSICAVLLAQACNIGLKTVARPEVPALTLARLGWVQQNYMRVETLTAANARLVEAQAVLPLAQAWPWLKVWYKCYMPRFEVRQWFSPFLSPPVVHSLELMTGLAAADRPNLPARGWLAKKHPGPGRAVPRRVGGAASYFCSLRSQHAPRLPASSRASLRASRENRLPSPPPQPVAGSGSWRCPSETAGHDKPVVRVGVSPKGPAATGDIGRGGGEVAGVLPLEIRKEVKPPGPAGHTRSVRRERRRAGPRLPRLPPYLPGGYRCAAPARLGQRLRVPATTAGGHPGPGAPSR